MTSLAVAPQPLRAILFGAFFALIFSLSGCKLIFEDPDVALDRFLQAAVEKDTRELEEMLEGNPEFDRDLAFMRRLSTNLGSQLYRGRSNYWRIQSTFVDEAADRTTIVIQFDVPRPPGKSRSRRGNKPDQYDVTFQLQRRKLRWYIMSIEPKEIRKVLKKMERSRRL